MKSAGSSFDSCGTPRDGDSVGSSAISGLSNAGSSSVGGGKRTAARTISGEPFSTYTRVLETWVEGERVFDFADPEHRRFAVGGEDTYRAAAAHHHGGEAR